MPKTKSAKIYVSIERLGPVHIYYFNTHKWLRFHKTVKEVLILFITVHKYTQNLGFLIDSRENIKAAYLL